MYHTLCAPSVVYMKFGGYMYGMSCIRRLLMSTCSELSMYQATCLKLEQKKSQLLESAADATNRMERGLPPTKVRFMFFWVALFCLFFRGPRKSRVHWKIKCDFPVRKFFRNDYAPREFPPAITNSFIQNSTYDTQKVIKRTQTPIL